jgi:predicted transcriptional regulator
METYSVTEASKILGISTRAVQKRCFKDKVRKKSNRYLITDEHIKEWFADIKSNEPTNEPNERSYNGTQELKKEIHTLELAFKTLDAAHTKLKQENEILKDELSKYEIEDNERIEVFTNHIEHKDELFDAKEKSLTELLEHYKNQFEYQKNQSTKILDLHQKLIDEIQKQSTITIQRNIIEAKREGVINDEWKTKK